MRWDVLEVLPSSRFLVDLGEVSLAVSDKPFGERMIVMLAVQSYGQERAWLALPHGEHHYSLLRNDWLADDLCLLYTSAYRSALRYRVSDLVAMPPSLSTAKSPKNLASQVGEECIAFWHRHSF